VRESRGSEFYSSIGHKGGQRVRELIARAKAREAAARAAGHDPRHH